MVAGLGDGGPFAVSDDVVVVGADGVDEAGWGGPALAVDHAVHAEVLPVDVGADGADDVVRVLEAGEFVGDERVYVLLGESVADVEAACAQRPVVGVDGAQKHRDGLHLLVDGAGEAGQRLAPGEDGAVGGKLQHAFLGVRGALRRESDLASGSFGDVLEHADPPWGHLDHAVAAALHRPVLAVEQQSGRQYRLHGFLLCRFGFPVRMRPARRPENLRFDGQCGRRAVCTAVCTFAFSGPKRLQCLQAVGPRPDSIDFRMHRMHRMQFP